MRPDVKASIDRYAKEHVPTGGFLRAVLENDLKEAVGRADEDNQRDLVEIVTYIYNYIPAIAWGSKERVREWIDNRP